MDDTREAYLIVRDVYLRLYGALSSDRLEEQARVANVILVVYRKAAFVFGEDSILGPDN